MSEDDLSIWAFMVIKPIPEISIADVWSFVHAKDGKQSMEIRNHEIILIFFIYIFAQRGVERRWREMPC